MLILFLAALPRILPLLAEPHAAPLPALAVYIVGTSLNFFLVRNRNLKECFKKNSIASMHLIQLLYWIKSLYSIEFQYSASQVTVHFSIGCFQAPNFSYTSLGIGTGMWTVSGLLPFAYVLEKSSKMPTIVLEGTNP